MKIRSPITLEKGDIRKAGGAVTTVTKKTVRGALWTVCLGVAYVGQMADAAKEKVRENRTN